MPETATETTRETGQENGNTQEKPISPLVESNGHQSVAAKGVFPHRFPRGVSGNPSGRPLDEFRAVGKKKLNGKFSITHSQAVVEAAFRKAIKGDSRVLPYVCDRLFGKVTQPIEFTGLENLYGRVESGRARLAARREKETQKVNVLQLAAKSNDSVIEAEAVETQVEENKETCE